MKFINAQCHNIHINTLYIEICTCVPPHNTNVLPLKMPKLNYSHNRLLRALFVYIKMCVFFFNPRLHFHI